MNIVYRRKIKNRKKIIIIIKTDKAFSGYAMPYKVEIIEKKRSYCTIRSK